MFFGALYAPRESFAMRKPETIETLYLDFDSVFGSQCDAFLAPPEAFLARLETLNSEGWQ